MGWLPAAEAAGLSGDQQAGQDIAEPAGRLGQIGGLDDQALHPEQIRVVNLTHEMGHPFPDRQRGVDVHIPKLHQAPGITGQKLRPAAALQCGSVKIHNITPSLEGCPIFGKFSPGRNMEKSHKSRACPEKILVEIYGGY